MNWRKKFARSVGIQILFIFLLSLILFGSSGAAEDLPSKSSKPAMVANLEFVNADLRQVLRYLAGVDGFQVLLNPEVQGVVSIAFKAKVPAKSAAQALAASSDLSYQWLGDGTTLYIGNSNLGDTALKNRILTLKYLSPTLAINALTVVIPKSRINAPSPADTPSGGSADAKENRLTISANELEWQNIIEIIQAMDRVLPSLTIETRIIELPETSFRELEWYSFLNPIQMGAFLFTGDQLSLMESHSQYSALYRREIPVLGTQAGRLTLEDQIPKVQENSQNGSVNYQIENLAVGMNLNIALYQGPGNKLTLWVTQKIGTIINTTPPKDGAGYVPVPGVREITSMIPWEPGQRILLSGALQRSEFNQLLNIPYKFPVLHDLFLGKNIVPPPQNTATQTAIVLIPQINGPTGPSVTNAVTPSPTGSGSQSTGSDFTTIPGGAEEKETLMLGSNRKISPTPTSRRGLTPTPKPAVSEEIFRIQYLVKKGDTLTRIAAKFGATVQAVIHENNLEASGGIKMGMTLIIPVKSNRVYTIKPKETLWRIAKRYGVSIEELKDLNGIADIEKVEAGQKIVLPVPVNQIKNPQF